MSTGGGESGRNLQSDGVSGDEPTGGAGNRMVAQQLIDQAANDWDADDDELPAAEGV